MKIPKTVLRKVFIIGVLALFFLPLLSYSVQGRAITEINLGHDFASKSGSTKVTLTIQGAYDYFSVSGTWSGSSPRWAAAVILTGKFDVMHYHFIAFTPGRAYEVQDGATGYNGYDFQWTWKEGIAIRSTSYPGYSVVYYHQGYKVRYWDFWGARHNDWQYSELDAESLVNNDYL